MPANSGGFNFSSIAQAFRPAGPQNRAPALNGNPDPSQNQNPNTQVNPNNNQQVRQDGIPAAINPNADALNPGGTDPNNPTKPAGSPLDSFKDLFTIDPKKEPTKNPLEDKVFNLDPKKLGEAVSKLDFTRGLNPESVAKALGGDAAEFGNILNQVTRSAYMMSTQMILQMMEGGIRTNNDRFSSTLDGKFRDFTIQSASPKNPALNHAAAKPVVAALKQQIAQQNPGLSASEVQEQAEQYFLAMGKAMNVVGDDFGGDGTGKKNPNAPKEEDWSAYLNNG